MRGKLIALIAVGLLVVLAGCSTIQSITGMGEPEVIARVNCGATQEYSDEADCVWAADQLFETGVEWGAIGGTTVKRWGITVEGTSAPDVYLYERFNMAGYRFLVPDGKYQVRLHFAETFDGITDAGQRVFSVNVNGQTMLEDFDPYEEGGGFAEPVVKVCEPVIVDEGTLNITFEADIQNPEINGIEILTF